MKGKIFALVFLSLWLSACSGLRPKATHQAERETITHTIEVKTTSPTDTVKSRSKETAKVASPSKSTPAPSDKAVKKTTVGAGQKTKVDSSKTPSKAGGAAQKATAKKSDGAPKNTEPLIMENAERLEGFRSRGEYILIGKVRFRHGELRFATERAVWSKEQNQVYCEQGMRITHRGSELTSDRGRYSKANNEAEAEGHVTFRDSTGEIRGRGNKLTYNRVSHDLHFMGAPEIRRLYFDTLPGQKKVDTTKVNDTLLLQAYRMRYNDSTRVAIAESTVTITRRKTLITCDKAEYRDKEDSLFLTGQPKVTVDRSQIHGDSMRMLVHDEEIRGLLVKGKALARSLEPKTDSTPERHSEVKGDSLQIAFADRNIDSVEVFRNTEGLYFDAPRPALKNRMQGERMTMRFKKKEVQSAQVVGGAKSTYYHLEGPRLQGRNVARGDTIRFAFADGEIEEVQVIGNAKGTYFGRAKKRKADSTATAAPADSLAPKVRQEGGNP